MNIIIIEDDARIADFLERGLRSEGHRLQMARTGADGLARALAAWRDDLGAGEPSLILLDLMLPDISGLEVCQKLRAARVQTPILMLTALSTVEDRISGLRLGADDYLCKPFDFEELLARIDALGRRGRETRNPPATVLTVGDLSLDLDMMQASRGGRPITLTARELALLELFLRAPGRLLSRERILANVWGGNQDPLTNIVDVYIRRLRNKINIEGSPELIQTQRGLGYRLLRDAD